MREILIISYFFPPANFAGSYRIASWAKYLHKFGYHPIIITRCWNEGQIDGSTPVRNNVLTYENHDGYDVVYVPYKKTLRDYLHHKYGERKFVLIRKMLSVFELISENFSNLFIPYGGIYEQAASIISADRDIKLALISGRPFQTYRFGYLLNKKYGIKWAPDYRDGWQIWNSNKSDANLIVRFLQKLEKASENKWCRSAAFFTATTDHIVTETEKILPIKGYKVMNGYDPDDYAIPDDYTAKSSKFSLLYNGTLYKTQDAESFIDVLRDFINELMSKGEPSPQIELTFLGLASDQIQTHRVEKLTKDISSFVRITPRISKKKVIEEQLGANILLFFPHKEVVKENYPSKIFEYFACRRPIMLYPTENSVIDRIIKETNTGICCSNKEEALDFLRDSYQRFKNGQDIHYNPELEKISEYTREKQTKVLAEIIDIYTD